MQPVVVNRVDTMPVIVQAKAPEVIPRRPELQRMTRRDAERALHELPKGKMRRYQRVRVRMC